MFGGGSDIPGPVDTCQGEEKPAHPYRSINSTPELSLIPDSGGVREQIILGLFRFFRILQMPEDDMFLSGCLLWS